MELRLLTKPVTVKVEDSTPVRTEDRPDEAELKMAAAAEPVLDAAGAAVKKKKKTRLVLVCAEDIKELEARGPCPLPRFRSASAEYRMCPAGSFAEQALLDGFAEIAEALRAMHDKQTAILEHYREYGYAYKMVEDRDEEA